MKGGGGGAAGIFDTLEERHRRRRERRYEYDPRTGENYGGKRGMHDALYREDKYGNPIFSAEDLEPSTEQLQKDSSLRGLKGQAVPADAAKAGADADGFDWTNLATNLIQSLGPRLFGGGRREPEQPGYQPGIRFSGRR
jgi:hypothetical protein